MRAGSVVVFSLALIACSQRLAAQSCTNQLFPTNCAGAILVVSSDPNINASLVAGGVGMWQTCPQTGGGFPSLKTSGYGDMTIGVALVGGVSTSSSGGCGQFRPSFDIHTGQVVGGTIELFDVTASGHDCEPIRTETIAHELGHALGLDDTYYTSCYGHIMGPPLIGGSRSVQADECAAVDSYWAMPSEQPIGGGAGDSIYDLLELSESSGSGGWWAIYVNGTTITTNGNWCRFPNGQVIPCSP